MLAAPALLAISGRNGAIGVACAIPQTAKDIKPDTAIEKAIHLIAVSPASENLVEGLITHD